MSSESVSRNSVSRNNVESPPEIVIVRRRTAATHEEPHGGVWKIAYADFMTAMMAFFLVMWLLNATDKQTMSAVASYFNPVKLTDRVSNPKGLHDPESGAPGKDDVLGRLLQDGNRSKGDPTAEGAAPPIHSEAELFKDPYGALARLASIAETERQESSRRANASTGEAYRDPFDPEFRFLVARANAQETVPVLTERVPRQVPDPVETPAAAEDTAVNTEPVQRESTGEPSTAPADEPAEKEIAQQIRQALGQAAPERIPNVEVTGTSDGILISLTDEFDFGMFAIASAEPRPEMVVIMDKVAGVLKGYPGSLVVRGHTDGRPFRTQDYDNWRLSSARAHMAYFMLVRGGVDEQRFERIEGHADRSLKVAGHPEAAQNRRIEILLRKAQAS